MYGVRYFCQRAIRYVRTYVSLYVRNVTRAQSRAGLVGSREVTEVLAGGSRRSSCWFVYYLRSHSYGGLQATESGRFQRRRLERYTSGDDRLATNSSFTQATAHGH